MDLIKAVGSGGGIAGWVVWRDWPLLWSAIIAASQFLDATKHVFPFERLHKAASDLTVALELLCIDAEAEWESIYPGKVRDEEVTERRANLVRLRVEAEHKYFPEGFEPGQKLTNLAIEAANAYFALTHVEDKERG